MSESTAKSFKVPKIKRQESKGMQKTQYMCTGLQVHDIHVDLKVHDIHWT